MEVETPILQPRYGGAFAEPFVTHSNELDQDMYLRIATELYLKRLIVGGLERVYEIGKDFRNESVSYKHQPEFTMLEWYEAYADYRDTMVRIENCVRSAAEDTLGTTDVSFRGHDIDFGREWRRLTFVETLENVELWTRDEEELRARLTERAVDTQQDRSWAELVDHAFSRFVEPELIEPTIVHDYPVELSPFARAMEDDPTLTERFEYFVAGMELPQRVHGDQRRRDTGGSICRAGEAGRRRARRPRLCRGARLWNASDRRPRARNRSADDGTYRDARPSAT